MSTSQSRPTAVPVNTRASIALLRKMQMELRAGDVVVFSSDGLVEAPSLPAVTVPSHLAPPEKAGELFGFVRLAASAAHWAQHGPTAEDVVEGIWADLTAWCGEQSHHDDMTLLVLRVEGAIS